MATSLKMSLTTVGKSGPPYTRVQSGHDLIRGDLRLGLPCELLIEGQIRGHLIFWSIQALTEVVQLTLPQHQKSWWPKKSIWEWNWKMVKLDDRLLSVIQRWSHNYHQIKVEIIFSFRRSCKFGSFNWPARFFLGFIVCYTC